MSSWLAQSTEISLSQQSPVPDLPYTNQTTPGIKYTISLQSDTVRSPLLNLFITKQNQPLPSHKPSSPLAHRQFSTATSRDKILQFGSSLHSQLPKKENTSSSSPWALFSKNNSKNSAKELLKSLMSPKQEEIESSSSSLLVERSHSQNLSNYTEQPSRESYSSPYLPSPPKKMARYTNANKKKLAEEKTDVKKSSKLEQERQLSSPLKSSQGKYERAFTGDHQQGKHQSFSCALKQNKKKKKDHASAVVPVIQPPSLGIFSLSYLMTKQGILSDFAAYSAYRDCIETTHKELESSHEQRLKQINESIKKEKREKSWGSLSQLFDWISPWISLGIGTTSVLIGGGIFSWAALLSGLITLTLTLLDWLNGWEALEKLIPSKNKELKKKIIGIVSFSLRLLAAFFSLATLKIENLGFSPLLEGFMRGIAPAIEGTMSLLRGAILWIRSSVLKLKAKYAQLELKIDLLNLERDDYLSKTEELAENIHASFESLSHILQLQKEIDNAFLAAFR